jgi:hypothetical protein
VRMVRVGGRKQTITVRHKNTMKSSIVVESAQDMRISGRVSRVSLESITHLNFMGGQRESYGCLALS